MGQINLDTYQINHMLDLLKIGSDIVKKTGKPIMLYRQTVDEDGDACEEIIGSLVVGYVIEQVVVSGCMIAPAFNYQEVFTFEDYSRMLQHKGGNRFVKVVVLLEEIEKICNVE